MKKRKYWPKQEIEERNCRKLLPIMVFFLLLCSWSHLKASVWKMYYRLTLLVERIISESKYISFLSYKNAIEQIKQTLLYHWITFKWFHGFLTYARLYNGSNKQLKGNKTKFWVQGLNQFEVDNLQWIATSWLYQERN